MSTAIDNQNKLEKYRETVHEQFVVDCKRDFKRVNANEVYRRNRSFDDLDTCITECYYAECQESYSLRKALAGEPAQKKQRTSEDTVPILFGRIRTREKGKAKPKTIKILLDTGGSDTIVNEKYVSKLTKIKGSQQKWQTAAGELKTTEQVQVRMTLPELHEKRVIDWKMHVTKNELNYDMIIGRDLLSELGIDIMYSKNLIEWDHKTVPFRNRDADSDTGYYQLDPAPVDSATERIKQILDAKYEKADLDAVAESCTHLGEIQQRQLLDVLLEHEELFDGTLGRYKPSKYNIELKDDAKPYHAKPFPVPKVHEKTLRIEIERLCEIGVLKRVNNSQWGAPSFLIPKKDGTVRFINDFRELNKRIKRKPYPIPKIQDMLLKLEGFQYATSLDLNMGYYHIELTPESKQLCTLVFPFGKFALCLFWVTKRWR